MKKLPLLQKHYYDYLDGKARHLASLLASEKKVTKLLLDYVGELYDSAKVERDFNNKTFQSSYHRSVTSEFEFLVARTLHHYSTQKKLGWSIYLRTQIKKTAPDIRITKNGRNLSIIEIKTKVGWMQGVFGLGKYQGMGVEEFRKQIEKQCKAHKINRSDFFLLLPSLSNAHRVRQKFKLEDYDENFRKNSRIPRENFILLSENLNFHLGGGRVGRNAYKTTERFENMIRKIVTK